MTLTPELLKLRSKLRNANYSFNPSFHNPFPKDFTSKYRPVEDGRSTARSRALNTLLYGPPPKKETQK